MSSIFLTPSLSVLLTLQAFLFLILSLAFYQTLLILNSYKFGLSSSKQYKLEKKSYLVSSIIYFSLFANLLLVPFFTFTLNELSLLIPGAMCGAGVISANEFGNPLLIVKLFILLLSLLWIELNHQDALSINFKYFRIKLFFFLVIFLLTCSDIFLSFYFFSNLSTQEPVLCCSNLYKSQTNFISTQNITPILSSFFILFIFLISSLWTRKRVLVFINVVLFTILAYFAIVYFFSTYIYELPSHKCPYCLLQAEYNFVGYFIYGSLLLGIFYALSFSLFNFTQAHSKKAIFWFLVFILSLVVFPAFYLLKNKTLL